MWSYVKQGIHSSNPREQTLSRTLLGFIDTKEAFELINTLLAESPDTWIKRPLETSKQRWQTNSWAKHWFQRFLSIDENNLAWASFRLLLQCVDTRFWFWRHQIEAAIPPHSNLKKRQMFLDNNLNTLENKIPKNEKALKELFLGQKVLNQQAWPWM